MFTAKPPYPVKQRWIRPIQLYAFRVDQKHRHLRPVLRCEPDLASPRTSRYRPELWSAPTPTACRCSCRSDRSWAESRTKHRSRKAWFSQRLERRRPLPVPAGSPRTPLPIRLKSLHHRARVLHVTHQDLAAGQRHIVDRMSRFGNYFAPVLGRRLRQVQRQHPAMRRFPVGLQEQLIAPGNAKNRASMSLISGSIGPFFTRSCARFPFCRPRNRAAPG